MSLPSHDAEESCLKSRRQETAGVSPTSDHGHPQAVNVDPEKGTAPYPTTSDGHSDASGDDFPEGGLEAWLVVLGSFCAMVHVFGLINTSGVFESYFKANQLAAYSHSEIGWIFSLYLFLVFFIGVQVGPLFDKYGPRWLVAVGSLLVVLSLMMLSLSTTYYQIILSYSVVGGLGGALQNAPAYGSIAHFFDRRRGLATGIASTAGGIGGVVFPLLLRHLLGPDGVGFAWSCRIMGFIMLGLAVPANLFIKSRLTRPAKSPGPVWRSMLPDLSILRDPRFAFASIGYFFMEYGIFVPLTYVISYGTAHGISTSDSSLLLSILNAGSVVGRFLPGLLADKFGRFNVIIVTILLCVVTTLGIWLPCGGSWPVLVTFCVLFGMASGSNLSLFPVCLGQLCDSGDYGRYLGLSTMIASFGTLSSVPIAGSLLELGGSTGWTALIMFAGLSYALALACYCAARVLAVGWRANAKF